MSGLSLARLPRQSLLAHPLRTALLVLLTLIQVACLTAGGQLLWNAQRDTRQAESRLGADILLYPSAAASKISTKKLLMQGTPVEVWRELSALERLPECPNLAAYSRQVYLRDTTGETPRWIVGYDPATDFALSPWTEAGDLAALPTGAVAAGCHLDATVTLFQRDWPIAAHLAETGSALDDMVFVPLSMLADVLADARAAGVTAYQNLDPDAVFSAVLIRVRSREQIDPAVSWLTTRLRKMTAIRSEAALTGSAAGLRRQSGWMAVLGLGVWGLLLAAQAVVYALLLRERRRELHLYRAVGASRRMIGRLLGREALLIGLIGGLAGLPAAWAITGLSPRALLLGAAALALTLGGSWISARLSARRTLDRLDSQMLTL